MLDKQGDLPAVPRGRVDVQAMPYDRHLCRAPRPDDVEIDDVAVFLRTLTDGYGPASGTVDPAGDVESSPSN